MIGLVARAAMGGNNPCYSIMAPIIAIVALCGIYKFCCKCRIRDCGCIKRFLRVTGTDTFDDFDIMMLVHSVKFTTTDKKTTFVRVTAGDFQVETDPNQNGIFQQTLNVFVEQGTEYLLLELLDSSKRKLAEMKMDIDKDILSDGIPINAIEKAFKMKQVNKKVVNPKITLTFSPESINDEEKALLSGLNASAETEWVLTQQIQLAVQESAGEEDGKGGGGEKKTVALENLSEVELLGRACAGPLVMFDRLAGNRPVRIAVLGPPSKKRLTLCICASESFATLATHKKVPYGETPDEKSILEEVDLLKVTGIFPDPGRPEVFSLDFVDANKARRHLKFERVDRGRDVWVEMIQLLVTKVHADKKKSPAKKKAPKK